MPQEKKSFQPRAFVRKTIRELLAIAFWTHALYVTNLVPLPPPPFPGLPRYLFNALLAVFILNYSLFSDRGWWSVLFDIGYVYFLPFFYTGQIAWFVTKSSFGILKKRTVFRRPQLFQSESINRSPTFTAQGQTAKAQEGSKAKEHILRRMARFTLLWSIFVFTVNFRPSLVLVALLTILGSMSAFRTLWNLFGGEREDQGLKVEEVLQKSIKIHLEKILSWNGVAGLEDIKGQLNSLRLYETLFNFLHDNRGLFLKGAFAASLIISAPFYIYMSYLFACSYVAIGKIMGQPFAFSSAILDSLYMPFAWTELPKNFPIRFIGGIQAIMISAVGYTIFFRHFGNRIEGVVNATGRLRGPMDDELVRQKIREIEKLLSQQVVPALTVTGSPAPKESEENGKRNSG